MEGEIFIFLSKQQLDLERETSSVLSTKSFIVNVNFGQCLISISFPVFVVGEGQGWRKMARQWWPVSIIAESGQWTPVTDCCWRPFIIKSIQQRKLLWIVNLDACFLRFLTKWAGLWTIGLLVVIGCWDNGFGLEACHSYQLDYQSRLELGKFEKQAFSKVMARILLISILVSKDWKKEILVLVAEVEKGFLSGTGVKTGGQYISSY